MFTMGTKCVLECVNNKYNVEGDGTVLRCSDSGTEEMRDLDVMCNAMLSEYIWEPVKTCNLE
jgi:hypothetical protein